MKGRSPAADERQWLGAICELGCIVCLIFESTWTQPCPHHMEGKVKPGAHFKTLPLCGRHHQISGPGYVSRHGDGKARFEAEYGTEYELLLEVIERLKSKD